MVTVWIASFEAIDELQRKRLHQSRAAVFSLNTQTHGQFLQTNCRFYRNFQTLGEPGMRKQCVPGSFFSAHALEPGNKAKQQDVQLRCRLPSCCRGLGPFQLVPFASLVSRPPCFYLLLVFTIIHESRRVVQMGKINHMNGIRWNAQPDNPVP